MKFHQVGREKLRQKVSDTCAHKSISLGLQPDLGDMAEASTDILNKRTVPHSSYNMGSDLWVCVVA